MNKVPTLNSHCHSRHHLFRTGQPWVSTFPNKAISPIGIYRCFHVHWWSHDWSQRGQAVLCNLCSLVWLVNSQLAKGGKDRCGGSLQQCTMHTPKGLAFYICAYCSTECYPSKLYNHNVYVHTNFGLAN